MVLNVPCLDHDPTMSKAHGKGDKPIRWEDATMYDLLLKSLSAGQAVLDKLGTSA